MTLVMTPPSQATYLAPTVYRLPGQTVGNWNYYNTLADAIKKNDYLNSRSNNNVSAAGYVSFDNSKSAPTFGLNVDFFTLSSTGWIPATYAQVKNMSGWNNVIFRFYKTDGSGPYYAAVLDAQYFGITATKVSNIDPDKLASMDAYYRELAILKAKYNTLAAFLNELAKTQLDDTKQQIFNEGIIYLGNMKDEIRSINGIDVSFSSDGQISGIGIIPLLLIAIILIVSAAVAWTIDAIVTETQKTKRINDAYDMEKWINDQQLKVAQQVKAGTISQSDGSKIQTDLSNASAQAQKVADQSSTQGTGLMDHLETFGIIALGILLVSKIK